MRGSSHGKEPGTAEKEISSGSAERPKSSGSQEVRSWAHEEKKRKRNVLNLCHILK